MPHFGSDQPDLPAGPSIPPASPPRSDSQKVPERPRTLAAQTFLNPYLQILLSVFLNAGSQIFLKLGADQGIKDTIFGIAGLRSGWVWLGILCLIVSLASWLYSLRFVPLNVAYNLAGLLHALVPIACWLFLGEKINLVRWGGILCVLAGVYVIARPVIRMEERL
jgi:multidrug transporter EmrE-like cation transporter